MKEILVVNKGGGYYQLLLDILNLLIIFEKRIGSKLKDYYNILTNNPIRNWFLKAIITKRNYKGRIYFSQGRLPFLLYISCSAKRNYGISNY